MIEKHFTDREQEEQVVFEKLLADVKRNLPDDLLWLLPSLSFIMFKPDAYLRGLVPSILKLLAENRVYAVKHTLKQLAAADIDSLYMFVKPRYIESWWIMEKTYKLAPTCPAIVVGNPEGYEHLSGRIRELVGPTTPILGTESNIRYKFRGGHRIFNLIHGTDDPASAVREALVFFGFNDIKYALEKAKELRKDGSLPDFSLSSMERLRPERAVELSFPRAKYNLKRDIFKRCTLELDAASQCLDVDIDERSRKTIDRLQKLTARLCDLLEYEGSLLNEERPPLEEKRMLLNIYYFQLRALSLSRDAASGGIVSFSRDSSLRVEARRCLLAKLALVDKCLEIARAMTTDLELKECDFDRHLAWLRVFDIPLDGFDEANLHAAWSVIPTEFIDFELRNPERPL